MPGKRRRRGGKTLVRRALGMCIDVVGCVGLVAELSVRLWVVLWSAMRMIADVRCS